MAPLSATHLTPHFSRHEMRYDETPAALRPNLEALARDLELLRAAAGVPLVVARRTYRSRSHNAELPGAAPNSQHLTAEAADFDPQGLPVGKFLERVAASGLLAPGGRLAGAQLIVYPLGSDHIHYGRPRSTRAPDLVLVQTSVIAAAPKYQAVAVADSARVYAEFRRRRGQVLLGVAVVLALLGVLFLLKP